jgi:hypothetical protein
MLDKGAFDSAVTKDMEDDSTALTKVYYDSTKKFDPRIIVAMTVGHSDFQRSNGEAWPEFDKGIWKDSSTPFVATLDFLRNEVTRRAETYFEKDSTKPAPKAWSRKKLNEWLICNYMYE